MWDAATGEPSGARIENDHQSPWALAWAPDGGELAVVFDNNVLRFFDARTLEEVGEPIESVDTPITSVAYSPDGSRLATGEASGITRQWSTATHEQIGAALEGQIGPVAGVAYSPDGSLLATTTLGFSTTRLWDAATGAIIGRDLVGGRTPQTVRTFFMEHFQGSRPAFAPDGGSLAVPNWDGTITVWDLHPTRWLEAACGLAGRELTAAEWRQFIGEGEPHPTCG